MIYDFPEPSSPIGQGDIFFGVPILDLTDDELPIIDDEGNAQTLPWEAFASAGNNVSAIVSVRPTIAIVGTQECDALRAPSITLFEVRPFRDVERKSKDTSKPSKWVPLITQHARINQKWFYLPADERVGFNEKMGADFLTPIRVPRLALERLLTFRKGRLNEVAKQHFRERLAEFFRRYAYDEWYSLTREELAEYQKSHPDAEPLPWQREYLNPQPDRQTEPGQAVGTSTNRGERGHSEFEADLNKANYVVEGQLYHIGIALHNLISRLKHHAESLGEMGDSGKQEKVNEVFITLASDRNIFSEAIEVLLPPFEQGIRALERSSSTYLLSLNPESSEDIRKALATRDTLSKLLGRIRGMKTGFIKARDTALSRKGSKQDINDKTRVAIERQSKVLDSLIFNVEDYESFALKMIFLINEKFGGPPMSEDWTE